jgi:hypothetical protein
MASKSPRQEQPRDTAGQRSHPSLRTRHAHRGDLEAFLGELLRCRALETITTGYRQLRVLDRWLEEAEIAARRIREP